MSDTETDPSAPGEDPSESVELRVAADLANLPVVRSVVGNVAGRADFDLDAIADLRLAVDEACSALIAATHTGAKLVCEFGVDGEVLRFDGAVPAAASEPPSTGTFGWQVLRALTDSATARVAVDEGGDSPWLHIELVRAKAEHGG